jgi:lipopolysaccharide export system protein LptA
MTVSGGELFYRRDERLIHLEGGATLHQGRQELQAGQMTLELDAEARARRLVARDHPVLRSAGDTDITLSGDELVVPLERGGRPAQVLASGNVALNALRADGRHQLTGASATLDLIPELQQPRHFTAAGDVAVRSSFPDGSLRRLQTAQLDVYFVSASQHDARIDRATAASATMGWETSRRSSSQDAETMRLKGEFLDGSFDQTGVLRELRGTGGVEVQQHTATDPPLTSHSRDLLARMAPDGQWSTIEQSGDVRLKNAGGDARGDRACFDRVGDSVTLAGSVVLTDASSQTRANTATFRQAAGELLAEGNVSTIELAKAAPGTAADVRPQLTHVTAARLLADTAASRAVYSGKARMWQGDSLIQADIIELDRTRRILIATGSMSAVFPQARAVTTQRPPAAAIAIDGPFPPSLWRAEAGRLLYEQNQHRARLEQGAQAHSPDGSMRADRMDLFFAPSPAEPITKAAAGLGSSLAGQQLQRAQGFGSIRVESAGRLGTAERADYSAAESKFILSGGHPKLIDQFGNSTAGRQLTFFFADDRIVVDSEEGSRTLTLHRVEK